MLIPIWLKMAENLLNTFLAVFRFSSLFERTTQLRLLKNDNLQANYIFLNKILNKKPYLCVRIFCNISHSKKIKILHIPYYTFLEPHLLLKKLVISKFYQS